MKLDDQEFSAISLGVEGLCDAVAQRLDEGQGVEDIKDRLCSAYEYALSQATTDRFTEHDFLNAVAAAIAHGGDRFSKLTRAIVDEVGPAAIARGVVGSLIHYEATDGKTEYSIEDVAAWMKKNEPEL